MRTNINWRRLKCQHTRGLRIDECEALALIDVKIRRLVDPDREKRIKEHTKRVQKELRRRKSSRKR